MKQKFMVIIDSEETFSSDEVLEILGNAFDNHVDKEWNTLDVEKIV